MKFQKLISKGFDYLFLQQGAVNSDRLDLDDLKNINWGIDNVTAMIHALDFNITVLNHLSQEATRRAAIEEGKSSERYRQFQEAIRTTINDQFTLKHQLTVMRTFGERRLGQVSDRLELCSSGTRLIRSGSFEMPLLYKTAMR